MNARLGRIASARSGLAKWSGQRWASLLGGEYRGKKAWKCRFCGVIGSHRRGCHYNTEAHHRPRKRIRRGMLGPRARASAKAVIA